MKRLLAVITALTMILAMASCGGTETNGTSSVAPTTAPTAPPVASIIIDPLPSLAPAGPANLALEATAFDMNEGKTKDDEGYIGYYNDENGIVGNVNDGNMSTGWQPKGNDDEDATPVTRDESIAEGFYDAEDTVTADDGTTSTKTVRKYNLHEGGELPEYWYFSDDAETEIREAAHSEDGKVYVGLKFAEAVTADCIVIKWENGSVAESYQDEGFYLEYTADGEKWEKLDVTVERGEDDGVSIADTATFEAVEATGFRVVVLRCINKWNTKLYELEVYAPEETAEETEAPAEADASEVVSE